MKLKGDLVPVFVAAALSVMHRNTQGNAHVRPH
jgi:hypothetical protein